MGLDTTHNCWHGPYSSFMHWRTELCRVAGYGDLRQYRGFYEAAPDRGPMLEWPDPSEDALVYLLNHSDCDGDIPPEWCGPIADRLEQLLPALDVGQSQRPFMGHADRARQFITGLRDAASKGEAVEFH